ncbi:phage baseplate protein [Paenibacillus sp. ACRRX]|uniref:LysM peptidoglycan-binding domain-containing protein n=1 Tax=unclassified Paenibacillus TaxID=185978 RepID=UPI0031BA752F
MDLFVTSEEPEYAVQVSTHNVEKGGTITDHIQKDTVSLHLEGLLIGPKADQYRHRLVKAMNAGTLLQYSGRNLLLNCAITSLRTAHDNSISNGMSFSMTLKQINVVTISYKKLPAKRKVAVKPKSRVGQKNATYRPKPLSHTVRRGQTWEQIAAYYGTSPYQLRSWNSHLDAHVPPPVGMILSIGQKASAKQKAMNPNLKHAVRTHKVVYGESWNSIASRYGTSPDILRGLNPNINGHTILKSGMVIRVL